ncbi:TolC family protein [Cellulophaga baltica]|uniref:TolC family protein n=1 Tax=Cellulophaga baltica TaxID=76594 RepID=UPI0015F77E09|nr:TolC family protein [Cellulophaga baltica]MBA6315702.1 TolC family protein [Cellulophaga baltica]
MKLYTLIASLLFSLGIFAQEQPNTSDAKVWTLEECIAYALAHNITIQQANINKQLTEVALMESKSSRLPSLSGTASQNLTNGNTIDPITSDFVSQQINSTSLSLNTSVTLFQGNQINNQIKQSKLLVDQYQLYAQESQNNITLNITEAYIQLLYAKEAIKIAENNVSTSQKEEERAKSLFDAGSIAIRDYTDAKSQTATNNYNLIAAKNTYDLQLLSLKQLLELSSTDSFAIVDGVEYLPENVPELQEVYAEAVAILPEINASKTNVLVSEKALDIAKGGYLPTLSLTGSLGSGYTSTQTLNFTDQFDGNFNQRVGLSLNVPIFNKNKTKAAVQEAQLNIDNAALQLAQEEKDLYVKVETAWKNTIATQSQLNAAYIARNAAKESYRLAQKQYELGALSTTDLILSQNTYTNTEQNYIQAKYLNLLYNQLLQFYQGNQISI